MAGAVGSSFEEKTADTELLGGDERQEEQMTFMPKRAGYSTVSPYLLVEDAGETIRFLVDAFDAVELRGIPGPDGKVLHAEVRIDDTVLMLTDAAPAVPSHVHVYVEDVDETYRRALEAGALSVQEPVQKDDEDKRGGVADGGGTTWWIATTVG